MDNIHPIFSNILSNYQPKPKNMNALDVFKELPFSKIEQQSFAQQIIREFLDGTTDPLRTAVRLRAMMDTLEAILADPSVKLILIEEAEKHGKTGARIDGVKIEVSSRTTKDYSGCGDSVINDLNDQLTALKAQISARQKMIDTGVNPETGETYFPPKKSTTNFLKYSF